ncbi:MAG: serine hydrolase [Candidatus Paceibacterota bacterium]
MKKRPRRSRFLFSIAVGSIFFVLTILFLPPETKDIFTYAQSRHSESGGFIARVNTTFSSLAHTGHLLLAQTLGANAAEYDQNTSGKKILINMEAKHVTLLLNDYTIGVLPILHIADDTTPHAPVTGMFSSVKKEREHFSSFLRAWFPYTTSLSENMFIHAPVVGGERGTFVLSEQDARSVYVFADSDTDVVIVKGDKDDLNSGKQTKVYVTDESVGIPEISAEAYLVADVETGEILLSKNTTVSLPIASITKLMTALVSKNKLNQYHLITLLPEAFHVPYAETGGLREGDEIQIREILYPILIESSNSAAHALALYAGYDAFLSEMNSTAKKIGMRTTHFSDPSGVSSGNTSTAEDIFSLIQYLYNNERDILNITRLPSKETLTYHWENNNRFVHLENYLGGKTGETTAAKQTLVSLFNMKLSEFESRPIVIVVLRSDQRESDVLRLYDYLREAVYFATTKE